MLCYLCYFQHSQIQSKTLLYRNPFHLFNHLNGAMPNLPQCSQQCPHKVLTMYFILNNVLNVLNNVLNTFSQCILYSHSIMFSKCPHNVLTMSSGAWSNVITHTSHSSGRLKRRFFFALYLYLCRVSICICVRPVFVFVSGLY